MGPSVFMQPYLSSIILLVFVCLVRSQIADTSTNGDSTASTWHDDRVITVRLTAGSSAASELSTDTSMRSESVASGLMGSESTTGSSISTESATGCSIKPELVTSSSVISASIISSTTIVGSGTEGTVTLHSTDWNTITSEPISSNSPIVSGPSTSGYSMTTPISAATNEMEKSSETYQSTNPTNVVTSSVGNSWSSTTFTTSQKSTSSASTISTGTNTTSTTSTTPTARNITAIYIYTIESDVSLKTGTINDTYAADIQRLVYSSFNLSQFDIKVLQSKIEKRARDLTTYNLVLDILFMIRGSNCDLACIESAKLVPTINISLPAQNGTSVMVHPRAEKPTKQDDTVTENYPTGGSSPGIPAQLGMGLGISFFGILLIAEMIFLYRKYGLYNSSRREQYAMTRY